MAVWDVLSRRRDGDPWQVAGSLNAPDLDLAMLLARETHFRHGEGTTFALRRRGEDEVHECPDPEGLGGVIDKEYRRQTGYVGVGAKLKRVHAMMAERGLVIDRPRPRGHRRRERADA
jgi:ring-1,2-phenylacetyl-CoA epoxidase subunit PaaB